MLKIGRKLQKHLTRVRFELDSKDKHPSLTQSRTKPRHGAADRTADRDALMAEVAAVQAELAALADADEAVLEGNTSAKFWSFSAVSAPIFASKYAFCSILQNLPDSQAEIFEIRQILRHSQFFAEISRKLLFFQTDFLRKF